MRRPFPRATLEAGALHAAPALLGAVLVHESPIGRCAGRIVEAEAYTQDDPASHSFGRRTPRNDHMYHKAGTAYVYRSYGVHWCFNIVTGDEGIGEAVLVRALEPLEGVDSMASRRGLREPWPPREVCGGPGRLTQAMDIHVLHSGSDLLGGGALRLFPGALAAGEAIVVAPRIGITRAVDWPRRFAIAGSRFLSRPIARRTTAS